MQTTTVGPFKLEVSAPYPCWVSIQTDRGEIRFSHHDLMHLEHVVKQAIREARKNLPEKDRGEV